MIKPPLALMPVVTVVEGKAALPPQGYGTSPGSGAFGQVIDAWANQSVAWVHVEDAEGAVRRHIGRHRAHVQLEGGIASDAALAEALAGGASRVVIESQDLEWALDAVAARDERVAVALDVHRPDAGDAIGHLQHAGASRFLVTLHGTSHHDRREEHRLLADLLLRTSHPVMVRGAIDHLSDLHALHELVPHGIDAILVDHALYDGSFTYSEAVTGSADRFDMFFWGPPE